MTFRELLDKYRAGQASEEERALVEAELEKSEAIADYLAEQVEDALGAAETQAPAGEVRHIQKKVNRRLRRTAVWAACIVLAALLGVRFVVSPLVSSLYYQPNAYTVGGMEDRAPASLVKENGVEVIRIGDLPPEEVERHLRVESQDVAVDLELHPKSWTRKSTKGVQKSMGKELFSEELKLAVVQYVLEGHTRKEASEKFCVSCTPIEKWVNLYKLHGAKGLLSRNLVGRQKGFDGEFRLKVLQYKQEHHLSCTQTAMHFCLDVVTVCRWEKKFQKEGAQGLMKKQATKGSEKRQKKQEQSELQQENKRLSEENYRLKMENDYLKKLNALIQKREKPE